MGHRRCAPVATADASIVEILKQMFVAARADDLAKLLAITTPDFFAYDGGKRFTAQTLMELVKNAHAAGKHYEWNVTEAARRRTYYPLKLHFSG
jgi:hypothetical protein